MREALAMARSDGEALRQRAAREEQAMAAAQARAAELEASVTRESSERARLAGELVELKEQLRLRDADLRASTRALHDLQQGSGEEKALLRAEIRSAPSTMIK